MERREINKIIRIRLGISAVELAKRVGCSRATIWNYESGKIHNIITEKIIELELDKAIDECASIYIKESLQLSKKRRYEEES